MIRGRRLPRQDVEGGAVELPRVERVENAVDVVTDRKSLLALRGVFDEPLPDYDTAPVVAFTWALPDVG
jgi:hypothetical protein